jgi:hypothetical protein
LENVRFAAATTCVRRTVGSKKRCGAGCAVETYDSCARSALAASATFLYGES